MKLTHKMIHEASTNDCGWNWIQLRILGVGWPPRNGWLSKLIGVEVDERTWDLFKKLRGIKSKQARAEICAGYGVNVGDLAQLPMTGPLKLGGRLTHLVMDFNADDGRDSGWELKRNTDGRDICDYYWEISNPARGIGASFRCFNEEQARWLCDHLNATAPATSTPRNLASSSRP